MEIQFVKYNEDNHAFTVIDTNGNQYGVPNDMNNRHRVMIQEWIDAGNTPEPYVEPEGE